jgi:hypothetical protein
VRDTVREEWLGAECAVVERTASSRFARFRRLAQPSFERMTPSRWTWQNPNLDESGDLRDAVDAMRRVSADVRRDSAFTRVELKRYARWRMKKKFAVGVTQDGSMKTATQPRRLEVPRHEGWAAESALRRESLAQRVDVMAARIERFLGWRRGLRLWGLRGRRLEVAADVCGRRTSWLRAVLLSEVGLMRSGGSVA